MFFGFFFCLFFYFLFPFFCFIFHSTWMFLNVNHQVLENVGLETWTVCTFVHLFLFFFLFFLSWTKRKKKCTENKINLGCVSKTGNPETALKSVQISFGFANVGRSVGSPTVTPSPSRHAAAANTHMKFDVWSEFVRHGFALCLFTSWFPPSWIIVFISLTWHRGRANELFTVFVLFLLLWLFKSRHFSSSCCIDNET